MTQQLVLPEVALLHVGHETEQGCGFSSAVQMGDLAVLNCRFTVAGLWILQLLKMNCYQNAQRKP